jgi:hypothetical protein
MTKNGSFSPGPATSDAPDATCSEVAFINLDLALRGRFSFAEMGYALAECGQIPIHGIAVHAGNRRYPQCVQIHSEQLHYLPDFGL